MIVKDKSLNVKRAQQTSDLSLSVKKKLIQVKNFLRLKTTESVFHFIKMHNISSAELVGKKKPRSLPTARFVHKLAHL